MGLLAGRACDFLTTSEEEAILKDFRQLAASIYPGIERQQALERLCADYGQLRSNVYREVSLACHIWKNARLVLQPELLNEDGRKYADVWEMLEKGPTPKFSVETWIFYRPLFSRAIDDFVARLDEIVTMHGDMLAPDFKELIMDSRRSVQTEQSAYMNLRLIRDTADSDHFFAYRFHEMSRILSGLAHEADRRQPDAMPGRQ
jgi:hypothetical protein